jgi:hypothetical protein
MKGLRLKDRFSRCAKDRPPSLGPVDSEIRAFGGGNMSTLLFHELPPKEATTHQDRIAELHEEIRCLSNEVAYYKALTDHAPSLLAISCFLDPISSQTLPNGYRNIAFECYQSGRYTSDDPNFKFQCPSIGVLLQHAVSDACDEHLGKIRALGDFLYYLDKNLAEARRLVSSHAQDQSTVP